MKKRIYAPLLLLLMVASATFYSCSEEQLGYEGNWSKVDSLYKNFTAKTDVKLTGNRFEITYSYKSDTGKIFVEQAIQKGKLSCFAEKMSFTLEEYAFKVADTSKVLNKFTLKDSLFLRNFAALKLYAGKNSINLVVADTLATYKYEVYEAILHLNANKSLFEFKRE